MSKINDVTDPKELATLSEDDLMEEHTDAMFELAHFTREKLHAEHHIQDCDKRLFFIEEEIDRREAKSKLILITNNEQETS